MRIPCPLHGLVNAGARRPLVLFVQIDWLGGAQERCSVASQCAREEACVVGKKIE